MGTLIIGISIGISDSEWVEIVDYFNTLMEKEEYRKLVDLVR